eukprot:954794-Amphidinium_carterae.1
MRLPAAVNRRTSATRQSMASLSNDKHARPRQFQKGCNVEDPTITPIVRATSEHTAAQSSGTVRKQHKARQT